MAVGGTAIDDGRQVNERKEILSMSRHRAFILTLCAATAVGFGASAARADDEITHFKIYGGPAYVSPLDDDDITFGTVTDSLEGQSHVGWNLGLEGRFNKLLGIELDYVNANQD